MTAALILGAGLVLICIPAISGSRFGLAGCECARLVAATLSAGFVAIELGLVLLALPTVLQTAHVGDFADICARVLTPLMPGGAVVGWVAGALAVVITVRALHAGWWAHRSACAAAAEPWLGVHEDRGDYELVLLPTDRVLAVSVPCRQPQVLISHGLVAHLDSEQLALVIRHEAAHHHFRHWRFSILATAIERALRPLPLVRRSAGKLRTALEAWADEDAAEESPRRRALLRGAIAAVASDRARGDPSGSQGAGVVERVRRLEHATVSHPLLSLLLTRGPVVLLAVGFIAFVLSSAAGMHHAAALAGYCPD